MLFTQIKVRYIDGSEGMVETPKLEELIDAGEISHFRRSEGWVDVIGAKTRSTVRGKPICSERRRDFLARQPVFINAGTVASKPVTAPQLGMMSRLFAAMYNTVASFL